MSATVESADEAGEAAERDEMDDQARDVGEENMRQGGVWARPRRWWGR